MRTRFVCAALSLIAVTCSLAPAPAAGQALASQVMGLYPERTGEVIFVDLKALRSSRHYAQIKTQALPPQFRSIEQWINALGMDFEQQVQQLSWAFVPAAEGGAVELVGVAEGNFGAAQVEQNARKLKLGVSRPGGALMVNIGRMDQGGEFVFAFLDSSTAVFGWRGLAEEIVTRRTQGGQSLLNNSVLQDVMRELNGRAPMWVALDKKFTGLALKQLLPGASQVPGFDNVAAGMQSAWLRFELRDGLRGLASLRCKDSSDALLFSSAAQAAIAYQALTLNSQNPDLSRALQQMRVDRRNESLNIEWNLPEPELVALLQKNSFTLNF